MKKLIQNIWFWRLKRKRLVLYNRLPVEFNKIIKTNDRILICMPENEQHFYTARDLIKTFTSKYKSILLVTREDMEILAEHKGKVYHYSDVDRNRMIIREKDLNAMPSKTDIAIDLNLKPTLLSAYITGTRGRKMTVGMRSGEFDRFYTVLMRSGKSYQDTIRTIFSFLGFMKS